MSFALVPIKTSKNQGYFLKNVSRFRGETEIVPLKCDTKLRLKDVIGAVANNPSFILRHVRVHRMYFKVDQILMEYPTTVNEGEKVSVLFDLPNLGDEGDMTEKIFMVTIPDSRVGHEVVRMVKVVYDKLNRVLMVLPEQDYKDWTPVGFEVSFGV